MLVYCRILRFRRGAKNAGRDEIRCDAIVRTKPLADDIDALLAGQGGLRVLLIWVLAVRCSDRTGSTR